MSVFKCKMCGGALEIKGNETVAVCEYCGTKQTLPRLDDDKKANLYDRANHFRRNNDFDKAMAIYEQILNEDNTDAEAYWSLVLCRYGIEYVEDPSSHKRIPTVNRAQFTSVFDDDNYKSALRYADAAQREVYEEEAKAINEIQKGILAISQKEEPFDVFICYKETDSNGRRTQDSVLANDLYHQLKQEGFKVFFSRITLEDKLGSAYEPYIFAALNSAKVMVVLGTKPEYLNAVWVKNEWSRYLALVKQSNGKKILIPAYRDMDPYDLPEEFSHLQAQDMSKLGFMQDLIRGIKKIISVGSPKTAVKETVVINGGNSNTAPLLKRAFMFLEDGNWEEADEYCEKVLDQDPENAQAYLGKLMAELRVRKQEQLAECEETFENNGNYQKALRFGSKEFRATLEKYVALNVYNDAITEMEKADTEYLYKAVAEKFKAIGGFKDADELARQCFEKADVCRKERLYSYAKSNMDRKKIASYEEAIKVFGEIQGWKDSEEQICTCQKKIEEMKAKVEADRLVRERFAELARKEAEKRAKRNKKIAIITTPIVCVVIAFIIVLNAVIIPNSKYNAAVALMDAGNSDEAYSIFQELGNYKDSAEKAENIKVIKNKEKLKNANVGSYITFGAYEQDNNNSNGKEDVEWLVLAKEGSKVLVISKYALDCQQYNTSYADVTWETCTLRKWLNNYFINAAFSGYEKAMIPTVTVSADKNPNYSTNPGNATQDQVFLLSITEANKYFGSDSARQCKPTDYAVANGAWEINSGNCCWWLRSPGCTQHIAAVVDSGVVDEDRLGVNSYHDAVRPALWVNIDT
mgnify:CR=1 FL=1